jgi:hypothetical protein
VRNSVCSTVKRQGPKTADKKVQILCGGPAEDGASIGRHMELLAWPKHHGRRPRRCGSCSFGVSAGHVKTCGGPGPGSCCGRHPAASVA